MTIFMYIFAVFSFFGLIFFSFKNKEFYQNESIDVGTSDVLGDILLNIIDFLPWYLKKLFIMLLFLGLCIFCICYFIFS
ncbi:MULTISPECIES: hypothetical protein [Bacillaceae]|uniref:Uncharacterized protein n=1 Tax=Gottfriedia luciferensis TaxID=178774 RepID=A0ABX2ZT58_9BACI|nr:MULTISPECIES: hypothetical protein [Bacillaceae]ODG92743.1 hypothetical protein BED47_17630 [Gottfriedia luciferensis]PGZ87153.1 hypothetical protein COE53_21395 [Bacillus sp. AFS029533]SFD43558.1 hypothetical protein SAMN02799633_03801 [Bacillus sp. UNCCL81]